MLVIRFERKQLSKFKTLCHYVAYVDTLPITTCIEHNITPVHSIHSEELDNLITDGGIPITSFDSDSFNEATRTIVLQNFDTNSRMYLHCNGTSTRSKLNEYGNIDISTIDQYLSNYRHPLRSNNLLECSSDNFLDKVQSAICSNDIIIVNKDTTYEVIKDYAKYRLDILWSDSIIVNLCCAIAGTGTSFNEQRRALYSAKPSLQGQIKSSDVLSAMSLEEIFKPEDFYKHSDELVSYIFNNTIILEDDIKQQLIYELNGNKYLRLQRTTDRAGVQSKKLHKLKMDSNVFNLSWLMEYNDDAPDNEKYIISPCDSKSRVATFEKDCKTLSNYLNKGESQDIPFKTSSNGFNKMLGVIPSYVSFYHTTDRPQVCLVHIEELPVVYHCQAENLELRTAEELKSILRHYNAPLTGTKEKLIERLVVTISAIYKKEEGVLNSLLKDYRGILLPTRTTYGAQYYNRPPANTKYFYDIASPEMKSRHEQCILEILFFIYVGMHTYSDSIFDSEYNGSLFSVEGLVEHVVKFNNAQAISLVPELKDINNFKAEEAIESKATCPF